MRQVIIGMLYCDSTKTYLTHPLPWRSSWQAWFSSRKVILVLAVTPNFSTLFYVQLFLTVRNLRTVVAS